MQYPKQYESMTDLRRTHIYGIWQETLCLANAKYGEYLHWRANCYRLLQNGGTIVSE